MGDRLGAVQSRPSHRPAAPGGVAGLTSAPRRDLETRFWRGKRAAEQVAEELKLLDNTATLRDVANLQSTALPLLEVALERASSESKDWLLQLQAALAIAAEHAGTRIQVLEEVATQCRDLVDMDFGLLYNSGATCSPSATTSASGDSMQVSMIYWPPRRGCPASSSLRRANSARSTGSHWAVC